MIEASLRCRTWNVGSRSDARVLRGLRRLTKHNDVLGLQETADREHVLRRFAEESGWTLVYDSGHGRGRTCMLVRPGLEVTDPEWIELSERTDVGPWGAGPDTIGRKWICAATVEGLRIGVVHYVASVQRVAVTRRQREQRDDRRRLWAQQRDVTIDWGHEQTLPVVILGDLNATQRYPGMQAFRDAGFELHTKPSHGPRGIDYVMGLDAPDGEEDDVEITDVTAGRGYTRLSDHRPVGGTAHYRRAA